MHQSLQRQQELEQAEELLKRVCEWSYCHGSYYSHRMFDDPAMLIKGLREWWINHKPKTEREKKLETIACAMSLDGKSNPEFLQVAERVLKALEGVK